MKLPLHEWPIRLFRYGVTRKEQKGEVNKRSIGKGVIFTCFLTRGVDVDLAADYSTDAFLMVFKRFALTRGYPRKVYSDRHLIVASKELKS